VVHAGRADRIAQGARHVILTDHLVELRRAMAPREHEITLPAGIVRRRYRARVAFIVGNIDAV
jgi:hypothetical protein